MAKKGEYLVVFITSASPEEARQIAEALVSNRKAACVNVVPAVQSRFWWRGRIESANEALLIVKTKSSLLDDLIALVKQNHSYEVPEIIAMPIVGGSNDYLNWLDEEMSKE